MIRESRQGCAPVVDLRGEYTVVGATELISSVTLSVRHGLVGCEEVNRFEEYQWDDFFFLDTELATAETVEWLSQAQKRSVLQFPPLRLLHFKDAIVTGNGTVLTCGGGLLRESAFEWFNFNAAPANFAAMGEDHFFHAPVSGRYVSGQHFLLKQIPIPVNYGHWLLEGVVTAALFKDRIISEKCSVIVPKSSNLRMIEIIFSSLMSVFPSNADTPVLERDATEAWRVDDLWYVTSPHVPPVKSRAGIAALRDVIERSITGSLTEAKRIYVKRSYPATRRLVNEDEMIAMLAPLGFIAVQPETMPFSDQVRTFRDADIVIGPKGANLTGITFMRPGTHVIALSADDFPDPFFRDIVSGFGIYYSEIYGSTRDDHVHGAGFRDFQIETKVVNRLLNLII